MATDFKALAKRLIEQAKANKDKTQPASGSVAGADVCPAESATPSSDTAPAAAPTELPSPTELPVGTKAQRLGTSPDIDYQLPYYTAQIASLSDNDEAKVIAYCRRGNAYTLLCQYENAIADYTQALHLAPRNIDAQRGLAYAFFTAAFAGVLTVCRQFADGSPSPAEMYYQLGLVHLEIGDYIGAIGAFTEAIRLCPEHTEAYFARGRARLSSVSPDCSDNSAVSNTQAQQVIEHARTDLEEAIRLEVMRGPACNYLEGPAHYYLGLIHLTLGDFQQAIHNLVLSIGDSRSAGADYRIHARRSLGTAYHKRACRYLENGAADLAIDDLNAALRDPCILEAAHLTSAKHDLLTALLERGRRYLETGKFHQASEDLTNASRLQPPNDSLLQDLTRAHYAVAQNYVKRDRLPQAIETLSSMIALVPHDAAAYISRGLLWWKSGKLHKAQADWSEAFGISPDLAYEA